MVENMRLSADIYKKIDNFCLDIKIESNAKRIGILGASGSGKSMTLRSIAGIENPDKGHIEIDGDVLYDSSKRIASSHRLYPRRMLSHRYEESLSHLHR